MLDAATLELALRVRRRRGRRVRPAGDALEHRRAADQHAALARAAKTLNEPLDLATLLSRICQEAAA